jgi:hypothetical protein
LLYDHLDFVHGVQVFIDAFPGASLAAMHEAFLSIGVEDNSILLFSDLMDSASLFLTANCDTVYFIIFLNLSDGPMVVTVPPLGPPSAILGAINDMWFGWVTDLGVSGPDRAEGGKYLVVGPGYDGPLPDSGYHVSHAKTSRVVHMLFVGGYNFLDPPPDFTVEGMTARISDGARKINARIAFFYPYTAVTPAMCMRIPGMGSQYLMAMRDGEGAFRDGARNYRLTLPPDIPESRFWSIVVYDRQIRSMLQTGQSKPDIGSQSGTVESNPDGSTDIYFGPTAPEGKANNWPQTVPGKGYFPILRLYNPLPSFFDKTWRPSEIEPI